MSDIVCVLDDGQEIALEEWSARETAKMRPLTETERAHLRVLLNVSTQPDGGDA